MHEFSLVKQEVQRIMKQIGSKKVGKITFLLGKLAHGTPESIKKAFEVATQDTNLSNAKVEIIVIEPKIKCSSCGNVFNTENELKLSCPKCSSFSNELISGNECYIKDIELDN